jgi:hypothetical protein
VLNATGLPCESMTLTVVRPPRGSCWMTIVSTGKRSICSVSVGLEDTEDLLADLEQALARLN